MYRHLIMAFALLGSLSPALPSLAVSSPAQAGSLATLQTNYHAALAALEEDIGHKRVTLNQNYALTLERLETNSMQKGDLTGTLAAKKERARFAEEQRVPLKSDPQEWDKLRDLQQSYRNAEKNIAADKTQRLLALLEQYTSRLNALEVSLTKQGKLEDAVDVRTEKDQTVQRYQALAAEVKQATAAESGGSSERVPAVKVPRLPGGPLNRGMLAYWPLDGNADDASSHSHHGEAHGATPTTNRFGKANKAYSFDGFKDYIEVPDSPLWNFGTNDFSICMWIAFHCLRTKDVGVIGHDEGPGDQPKWVIWFGPDKTTMEFLIDGSMGSTWLAPYKWTPVPDRWYHVALTKKTDVYTFYIDGTKVSCQTSTLAIPDASAPLTIGRSEGAFYLPGSLDEVRIYDRALASNEVWQLIHMP